MIKENYWIEVFKIKGDEEGTETIKSFDIDEYWKAIQLCSKHSNYSLDFWKDKNYPRLVLSEKEIRSLGFCKHQGAWFPINSNLSFKSKRSDFDDERLRVIENFIMWFSSDEDEREKLVKCAVDYLAEDHEESNKITAKYLQTIEVYDKDVFNTVEVDLYKLKTGGIVGIDGSFLGNTDLPVYSPFDKGIEIKLPD